MSISYIKEKIKGLIETEEVFHYLVVIAVFLAVLATFGIWKLVTYSKPSPINIEAPSSFKILTQIVLPLLVPGIIATSLFTFVSAWNEFFFALVLIQSPGKETLPLLLARFMGSEGQVLLGPLAAGAFIATIPSLLVFAIIQRKFATGLLSGAVKG